MIWNSHPGQLSRLSHPRLHRLRRRAAGEIVSLMSELAKVVLPWRRERVN
jgi:hypothetical protein